VTKLMRMLLPVALCALAIFSIAGCGGDDNSSSNNKGATGSTGSTAAKGTTGGKPSGGAATKLKIAADPSGQLKFDKTTLDAKAGKVTITMDNPSSLPHAVGVRGNGVDQDGKTVGKGGVSTVTANLKAGTYTFYCPVDGHEAGGMKGSLTVK
jgi:plastocyanin